MPYLDIPVPVRWSDLDGYGHVNNTAYLRLLEEARTRAFWQPSDTELANGAPAYPTALTELSPGGAFHTLVAAHTIEYARQLGYRRDGVIVRTWISKLGERRSTSTTKYSRPTNWSGPTRSRARRS